MAKICVKKQLYPETTNLFNTSGKQGLFLKLTLTNVFLNV